MYKDLVVYTVDNVAKRFQYISILSSVEEMRLNIYLLSEKLITMYVKPFGDAVGKCSYS